MRGWLLLALCLSAPSLADSSAMTPAKIQAEIDRTVWRPFKSAFETLDGDALNQLYGDQVLRVTPGGLDTQNRFKLNNLSRFDGNRERGDAIALDFWFDSRHTNESTSYEVGFYRIAITSSSGEKETFYGQFHIVLSKQQGEWKIVQDWDTDHIAGEPIGESLFQSKSPAHF